MSITPGSVFAGLTQEELDRAYDQDHWAPDGAAIRDRIIARSETVASRMPPIAVRYGPGERQMIDLFIPGSAQQAPVLVFVHGGAWRMSMREACYAPAPAVVTAGCIFAVIGFDCIPTVTLTEMVAQVGQAISHLAATIGLYGGDPDAMHIIGHSSGAHLAAAALAGSTAAKPVGATLISGLYDLEPVMLSSRRHYLTLSPTETAALSPIRHSGSIPGKILLWWGTSESPEFKRQSRAFAIALRTAGRPVQAELLYGRNHFEMLGRLEDRNGTILRAALASIGREPAIC